MKPASLLIAAFLAPALFCHAQNKAPADQPAAQDAARPTASDAAAPAITESYVIGASDVIAVTRIQRANSVELLARPAQTA